MADAAYPGAAGQTGVTDAATFIPEINHQLDHHASW